jgi:hypothetical protein
MHAIYRIAFRLSFGENDPVTIISEGIHRLFVTPLSVSQIGDFVRRLFIVNLHSLARRLS